MGVCTSVKLQNQQPVADPMKLQAFGMVVKTGIVRVLLFCFCFGFFYECDNPLQKTIISGGATPLVKITIV